MTSERQMKLDAIDAYPHLKKNPNRIFFSENGDTAYALVRGAVACIQAEDGSNFLSMTLDELVLRLRKSFPDDF